MATTTWLRPQCGRERRYAVEALRLSAREGGSRARKAQVPAGSEIMCGDWAAESMNARAGSASAPDGATGLVGPGGAGNSSGE